MCHYSELYWFLAHLLQTLIYIYVHKGPRMEPRQKSAYSVKLCYISIKGLMFCVQCTQFLMDIILVLLHISKTTT